MMNPRAKRAASAPCEPDSPAPTLADPASTRISAAEELARWSGDPQFMQSLARGLLALGMVADSKGRPVSARQIALRSGLSQAAAQRCLYTLDALGYVQANRNGAVPGPALMKLTRTQAAISPLVAGCGPILDVLHEALGVTVSMAIFDGPLPMIVASRASTDLLRLEMPLGATVPLHCTSIGKGYLAALSEAELDQRLASIDLQPRTIHTITSRAKLKDEVRKIRQQGFAISDQELLVGVCGASVLVRDIRGVSKASINVTMIAASAPMDEVRGTIIPALIAAAADLGRLTQ